MNTLEKNRLKKWVPKSASNKKFLKQMNEFLFHVKKNPKKGYLHLFCLIISLEEIHQHNEKCIQNHFRKQMYKLYRLNEI